MESPFFGREFELQAINKLFKKRSASLVVIQGRRRIGKSRLIEKFAEKLPFYTFSGIAPTEDTTEQSERDEFALQLSIQTGLPEVKADDWTKLFLLLAEKIKTGRRVVLFDEISWIGSKDSEFLGKFINAWDRYFKKNAELIFILCGSSSIWIEDNILSNTGFLGRISYRLTLEELPLPTCNQFWEGIGGHVSSFEKLKVMALTGGVPRYLEEVKPTISAEENIKDLCFTKGGALVNEFEEIFSDLYQKKSPTYKKIVKALSGCPLEIKDICAELKIKQTGYISDHLEDLIKSGFVTRDYTWHLNSNEVSRLSHFRLSDNYLRFYLKYVDKYRERIENGDFTFKSLSLLPNWDGIMGLQFENIVLNNRMHIKQKLGLSPDEVVSDNPFFQRKTKALPGCQIDYLIQTKFKNLYVCEIKFSKNKIGMNVIREVEKKLRDFQYPKGFSCRPVLIHVNGVTEEVMQSGFFSNIIDFGELFERVP
jgi:AAA+ ATPase superfamily predicted ATPase